MREMRETLRATFDRVLRLENRRSAPRHGTLDRMATFESKILDNVRQVTVFLPPDYDRGRQRYPVLYMQDGQNLFEPQRAFIPGQSWNLDGAADGGVDRSIFDVVDRFAGRQRPRIWLDVGGREGGEALRDARALRDRLFARGWSADELRYCEDRRGDHSERAWARRTRPVLEFLFPAR